MPGLIVQPRIVMASPISGMAIPPANEIAVRINVQIIFCF